MAYFLLLLGQGVLLSFAVLREFQPFWLNSGGYPLWLRQLVQSGFYPYLAFLTLLHWGLWPGRSRNLWLWVIWGVSTLVWSISLLWFSWNNVENLLCGRGMHDHY